MHFDQVSLHFMTSRTIMGAAAIALTITVTATKKRLPTRIHTTHLVRIAKIVYKAIPMVSQICMLTSG
jgi:hypothetical protein